MSLIHLKHCMVFLFFIILVENHTTKSEADLHICQMKSEDILKICKEATADPLLRSTKVNFVEGSLPGERKVYEFTLGSYRYHSKPPLVETACACPTNPLLYLRDKSSGKDVEAFVSLRESYSRNSYA